MADEINTLSAGKLRRAMKAVGDNVIEDGDECIRGDHLAIWSERGMGRDCPRMLVISKDGKPIASIPFDKAALKRLKLEMIFWNDIQTGNEPLYHAHQIRGRSLY